MAIHNGPNELNWNKTVNNVRVLSHFSIINAMISLLLIKRKLNHLDPPLLFNLLLPLVQDFRKIFKPATVLISYTAWKVCPYSEFFSSVLSRIRTESGEIYGVSLRIQSECGKMWTRKTLNMDTFHAVLLLGIP